MSHQTQHAVTLVFTCRNQYIEKRLQNLSVVSKCSLWWLSLTKLLGICLFDSGDLHSFYQLGVGLCIWITDPSLCGPAANKLILFSYHYGLAV